jgi:hypothetical protein
MHGEQNERRWRLVSLVERHFGRDYDLVARIIEEKTGGKVSERTVQAWLIAPGRKSSRNCPEWAVKALEEYVTDPANHEHLQRYAARREATLSSVKAPLAWSDEVRSSRAVELATALLEYEDRKLRVWQDASGGQVGKMLFELERRLDAEMNAHRKTLTAIHEAFRTSSTYEECKSTFQEHVRAADLQDFFVREAKRAIESSSDEFATPDAVIQQPPPEAS